MAFILNPHKSINYIIKIVWSIIYFLQTRAVDMFAIGCLYYYILSNGKHPFGKMDHNIYTRIEKAEYQLNELECPPWQVELVKVVVECSISSNPEKRPSCSNLLQNPIFWDFKSILNFLTVSFKL